jgi:glycine/D-amino acid oxidase-like deaminating enzyme/L-amino acid N-acyltransferase YncA
VSYDSRKAWFDELLSSPADPYRLWVLEDVHAKKVVGWIAFSPFRKRPAYYGTVEIALYVAPELQGTGVGTLMMDAAIRVAPTIGVKTILSVLSAQNEASVKSHLKNGFQLAGRLSRALQYPDGSFRDILILQLSVSNGSVSTALQATVHAQKIAIIGAGVVGLATAVELHRRGFRNITLFESSATIPHRASASGDHSRVVRADYGDNVETTKAGLLAIDRWRALRKEDGSRIYTENGILFVNKQPWKAGCMEVLAYTTLRKVGVPVSRLQDMDPQLRSRLAKGVNVGEYVDGYFNPWAGFAEASAYTRLLYNQVKARGIDVRTSAKVDIASVVKNGGLSGFHKTIISAGSYTSQFIKSFGSFLKITAHPISYFAVPETTPKETMDALLASPIVCPDMEYTGYYIFPAWRSTVDPKKTLVKIGHHSQGLTVENPEDAFLGRAPFDWNKRNGLFKEVLQEVYNREASTGFELHEPKLCCYGDSADGEFIVDEVAPGVLLCGGDSGHLFKFGPVIGEVMADAFEQLPRERCNPVLYDWRIKMRLTKERMARAAHPSEGDAMRAKL